MNHPNKLVFLSLAFYLSSCDAPATKQTNNTDLVDTVALTEEVDTAAISVPTVADLTHKHYESVMEMVEDRNDFSTEDGTLKLISKSPLHIQISHQEDKNQDVNRMKRVAMQYLISNAYAAFACTDVSKVTITSVPSDMDEFINNQKLVFLNAAAVTVTITRDKARQVMQSRVGTSNFDDMLGITVGKSYFADSPSPLLNKLKAEDTVEDVISELKS